jgi:hypothetical protein
VYWSTSGWTRFVIVTVHRMNMYKVDSVQEEEDVWQARCIIKWSLGGLVESS